MCGAVGGHRRGALRPDDDLKLGKLLKMGGWRPDLAVGAGSLYVEWYGSLRRSAALALVRGEIRLRRTVYRLRQIRV